MRECVNPHAAAFSLWICVLLNFSRGGWRRAIGHSVNVSGSEQPGPRQTCTVACHSHSSCLYPSFFFLSVSGCCLFSPLLIHPIQPILSHTFIIVFYLCRAIACRKIAHPVIDKAGFFVCFCFLSLHVFPPSLLSSVVTSLSHITQFHRL